MRWPPASGFVVAASLVVAACAGRPADPFTLPPPDGPALSAVIGHEPEVALKLLGPPTLDRREGPARHLQFARAPCVLDLYYYPPEGGGRPVAWFADARTAEGEDMIAAECLARLTAGRPSGPP
ncbi:MAG: hypothetical protein NZM40_03870 [Sphingomonadaceae bacterium]|uniref:hypothetical protein n=1 Tax=Thermaurantiacus sp. TaxID=2820283 RepID=UPI00298EF96C|nr:hypothetical protein [Thermaurantiacus sp.]MCS6986562.1 hypothetical protein [Sphingomonadaceae bacterium]MDW8414177.1 hypothetical protein [Thermaurantiacus sp.]